ncbi:MAG: COG4280 domain-containing protein [Candidatus Bathyarchaeia archaeon]
MIDQSTVLLFITVAVASAVEATEALTILLASGITRGWRSTFEGAALALAILALIVLAVGTALINYVPLYILRTVVGMLLLIFGLQWLTKAILRQTGFKAEHNEHDIYDKEVAVLSKDAGIKGKRDSLGFAVSFKGVLLEGMEVVMIVISFGLATRSGNQLVTASLGAFVGVAVMVAVAAALAKPLTRVPENYMKLGVGCLLTVFGMFWMGEGVGVMWPMGDAFLLVLLAIIFLSTIGLITYFERLRKAEAEAFPQ